MSITSAEGAEWAAALGVERVVVGRELSVREIAQVCMAVCVPVYGCVAFGSSSRAALRHPVLGRGSRARAVPAPTSSPPLLPSPSLTPRASPPRLPPPFHPRPGPPRRAGHGGGGVRARRAVRVVQRAVLLVRGLGRPLRQQGPVRAGDSRSCVSLYQAAAVVWCAAAVVCGSWLQLWRRVCAWCAVRIVLCCAVPSVAMER
jgi:hypothetical protein